VALEVFAHQFDTIPAYRDYCRAVGRTPANVAKIEDIPMVSTAAFKFAALFAPGADKLPGAAAYLTSGTTIGRDRRGRHVVEVPEVYRVSAIAHLRRMMFPDGARMRILALHPWSERMPESSLSAMISWCAAEFGTDESLCAADHHGVNVDAALQFLRKAEADAAPVCILATTAAAAWLLRRMTEAGAKLALAVGSRMMDTGGPKGQRVPLGAGEVVALAASTLGIAPSHTINEYGMTELCSQLYDATALNGSGALDDGARVKIAPAWTRPAAIDPQTFERLPAGQPGMLAFFDLANVSSVSAVLTEDLGVVDGKRVRVICRAQAGGPRGCALAIEQFESAARVADSAAQRKPR
jgi:hypothetical protein